MVDFQFMVKIRVKVSDVVKAVCSRQRQEPRQQTRGKGKAEAAKKLPRGCLRARHCLEDYITG